MAIEYNSQDYTTGKQILVFPDHYVAVAQTFLKNDPAATTVGTRKILKAGTIWPSNDGLALGVVFNDQDVTDGDRTGALLLHAFINPNKLPAIPTSEAINALKSIEFVGIKGYPGAMVQTYPDSVYVFSTGGSDYDINATGVRPTITVSETEHVDYDVNVAGIAPLFPDGFAAAVGFVEGETNGAVVLVEIPFDNSEIFDYTSAKYNGNALTADDVIYIDGRWYMIMVKGLKESDGVISGGYATFTLAYGDGDAKTFAWKYAGLTLEEE